MKFTFQNFLPVLINFGMSLRFLDLPVLNSCTMLFWKPSFVQTSFANLLLSECFSKHPSGCVNLVWNSNFATFDNLRKLKLSTFLQFHFRLPCFSIISRNELVVDAIQNSQTITFKLGALNVNLEKLSLLVYYVPLLIFVIQPIPGLKGPYKEIWVDHVPLTIQSKLIFIESGTTSCL